MITLKNNKNRLIKGAFVVTLGGLITKVLGAVYRIPLTNLLGAKGIGIYQMVFPLYSLLLTVSSTGVPSGISKIIAGGENPESVLKSSLLIFAPIGFICTVFMAIFSKNLAVLQGDATAKWAYLLISPSVLAVSVICCFRGYFQGHLNMKPTATSQVLEQSFKLVVGLGLVIAFKNNVILSASLATLAVTVSEIFTCLYFILYKKIKYGGFKDFKGARFIGFGLFKKVFPVMISTLILPLYKAIEGFFIINLLNAYLQNATELYGLYSGAVESLVSLPVSVCYGLSITAIPIISSLKSNDEDYKGKSREAIGLTFLLSLFLGVAFFMFSPLAVKILYSKLSLENQALIIKMLKLSSLSVVLLPLMQTLHAVLIGVGKPYACGLSVFIACNVKLLFSLQLLKNPTLNIFAVILTDIICYLLACLINLVYISMDGVRVKRSILRRQYE